MLCRGSWAAGERGWQESPAVRQSAAPWGGTGLGHSPPAGGSSRAGNVLGVLVRPHAEHWVQFWVLWCKRDGQTGRSVRGQTGRNVS